MPVLSLVRVAEPWTAGGIVAFIALLVAVAFGIAWLVRRISD